MYDPAYFVEADGQPMCVVEMGGITTWVNKLPEGAWQHMTIWLVDESGEAARVVDHGQA